MSSPHSDGTHASAWCLQRRDRPAWAADIQAQNGKTSRLEDHVYIIRLHLRQPSRHRARLDPIFFAEAVPRFCSPGPAKDRGTRIEASPLAPSSVIYVESDTAQRRLAWTGPKLGLSPPSRTLPLSMVLAGAKRTGPKLGLSPPSRTLPLSMVLAGAKRTGPKLGLSPPSRTLPASATLTGIERISTLSSGS